MDEVNVLLALPPHANWKLSECEPFLSKLVDCYQRYGTHLKVTLSRDVASPAEGNSDLLDSFMLGRLSPKTIRLDLTDAELYRSLSSVMFALVTRLMTSDIDVPVEFASGDEIAVFVHGKRQITLPRHHVMLGDPFAKQHLENYEDARGRAKEALRLVNAREMKAGEAIRRLGLHAADKVIEQEKPFIRAWDRAFLSLIFFVEQLSAEGKLTDAMKAALSKLSDGAYKEALGILSDGAQWEADSPSLRTPDELLLRSYVLQTHVGDPAAGQEAYQTLEKAAQRETEQLSNGVNSSSGTSLLEFARRQMVRQDYERAVTAADLCLQHPACKGSAEVLHLKGVALTEVQKYPEADRAFEKAIARYREEASGKPVKVLPALALCLCDKAKALNGARKTSAAKDAVRQAQEILVQEVPGQELLGRELLGEPHQLGETLDGVSSCAFLAATRLLQERQRLLSTQDDEQAAELLDRILHYTSKAFSLNPSPAEAYLYGGAIKAEGWSMYLKDGYERDAANKYQRGKNLVEELRMIMPDAFPVLLADICNDRGIALACNEYTLNEAKEEYLRALALLEKAPSNNTVLELMGDCYYDLGMLYSDWGKRERAEEYLRLARGLYAYAGNNATREKLLLIANELNKPKTPKPTKTKKKR